MEPELRTAEAVGALMECAKDLSPAQRRLVVHVLSLSVDELATVLIERVKDLPLATKTRLALLLTASSDDWEPFGDADVSKALSRRAGMRMWVLAVHEAGVEPEEMLKPFVSPMCGWHLALVGDAGYAVFLGEADMTVEVAKALADRVIAEYDKTLA